jgi:hypothetical protein
VLNHGHKSKAGIISRVPAQELEEIALYTLKDRSNGSRLLNGEEADAPSLLESIERIDVLENQITITLEINSDAAPELNDSKVAINVSWSKPSKSRKKQLIGSASEANTHRPMRSEVISRLLKGGLLKAASGFPNWWITKTGPSATLPPVADFQSPASVQRYRLAFSHQKLWKLLSTVVYPMT